MAKRGIEARWCEFCESAPVGEVEQMLRLGRSIVSRRKKKESIVTVDLGNGWLGEVPAHPEPLTQSEPPELFERNTSGEIETPF